jgi:hypothetical protein
MICRLEDVERNEYEEGWFQWVGDMYRKSASQVYGFYRGHTTGVKAFSSGIVGGRKLERAIELQAFSVNRC